MTLKGEVFIATSLDGFIARRGGGIDWLRPDADGAGEDYGYQEFFDGVDALVMGRNTFDLVLGFGEWHYGRKPVVVLTNREIELPVFAGDVRVMRGAPVDVANTLAEQGFRHLYVDGGRVVQAFLRAGLIHRMTITRVPLLIGEGIPLFGSLPHDVPLRHVETRAFPSGYVQSVYDVPTS
jgi:dihydrofolate reductase